MPNELKKVIVITGTTRGCGRAMVERFAEAGHTVVGCGRNTKSIQELRRQFPSPHRFDVVDVANDDQVQTWARSVLDANLIPDLLLNNAAVINRSAPLWTISAQEFQQVIDVNIAGTANVIRHFLPSMIDRNRGTIVNFSSGWGRTTAPDVAPYCATKFAIEGLSQALAQELPKGMAAVALNPGIINTEMLQSCFSDAANHYPTPDEWSRAAVPFLLSIGPKDNGRPLSVEL
ncbi:SDR family oxidoreductase [Schlesneria paludicola]|uniref:SDR family oxidoreductase n=1 Tax=Schlesneria paludicola TaxID=360056 RepID=UPI00029A2C95|nr:SDR family NAD(P)-dependent oxidoreductase [Schlesneria paludicola]